MLLSDPFAPSSLRGAILSGTLVSIVSVHSFPRVGQRVGQRPPRASHCSSGATGLLPVCLTPPAPGEAQNLSALIEQRFADAFGGVGAPIVGGGDAGEEHTVGKLRVDVALKVRQVLRHIGSDIHQALPGGEEHVVPNLHGAVLHIGAAIDGKCPRRNWGRHRW